MKKLLLLIALLPLIANTQTIKNGAFENWTIFSYDQPNQWMTSNSDRENSLGLFGVSKVDDGSSGFAVKMETKMAGSDLVEAWISASDGDPMQGKGGFPFSQLPTKLTGKYQAKIMGIDTNLILVVFKKNGAIIFNQIFKFPNSATSPTPFNLDLSLPQTPDTAIIAAAASNIIDYNGVSVGTNFILDDLKLEGPGVTQTIPNGNFNAWTSFVSERLPDWSKFNRSGVSSTTDAYRGYKAIRMETKMSEDEYIDASGIRLSKDIEDHGQDAGIPYSLDNDTLFGFYKFTCTAPDSAFVFVRLSKNSNNVGWFGQYLPATNTYTKFSIPFVAMTTPDSLDVVIQSSSYDSRKVGSVLIVDEVQLASSKLNTTGISELQTGPSKFLMYPNPAGTELYVNSASGKSLFEIFSFNGQTVLSYPIMGTGIYRISIDSLENGIYFCRMITSEGECFSSRLLKE